jgi:hypothetical protein
VQTPEYLGLGTLLRRLATVVDGAQKVPRRLFLDDDSSFRGGTVELRRLAADRRASRSENREVELTELVGGQTPEEQ